MKAGLRKTLWLLAGTLLAALLFLELVVNSPHPLQRRLKKIQVGMSRADVERVMSDQPVDHRTGGYHTWDANKRAMIDHPSILAYQSYRYPSGWIMVMYDDRERVQTANIAHEKGAWRVHWLRIREICGF